MEGLFFGFSVELVDKVSANSAKIVKEINRLQKNISAFTKTSKQAAASQKPFKVLRVEVQKVGSESVAAKNKVLGLGSGLATLANRSRTANKRMSLFSRTIASIGIAFTASAIIRQVSSLARAFVSLVKEGAGFTQTMAFAAGVMGATAQEASSLEAEAIRLATTTSFTAQQAAEGFVVLAQKGVGAKESIDILGQSLFLAGAGMISIEEATTATTDVLNVFGLASNQAERVANTLTKTFTGSSQSATELRLALKQAASTASSLGVSVEETSAAIGAFAQVGFRGASGGVALRNAMAELTTPGKKLETLAEGLGKNIEDFDIKSRGLVPVLKELTPLTSDVGLAFKTFGKRTAPAILALAANVEQLDNVTEAINSSKTAFEVYMSLINTTAGAMALSASAASGFRIQLFKIIEPEVINFLKDTALMFARLKVLVENLAPVIEVVFKAMTDTIRGFFRAIGDSFPDASNAFTLLTDETKKGSAEVVKFVAPLTLSVAIFIETLKEFFSGFLEGFKEAWRAAILIAGPIVEMVGKITLGLFELLGITNENETAAKKFGKVVGVLIGLFTVFATAKLLLAIPAFVIRSMVNFGIAGVTSITSILKFAKAVPGRIDNIKKAFAAASPAIKTFALSVKGAALAVGRFALAVAKSTLALLANPVVLTAVAIAALVGLVVLAIAKWEVWVGWLREQGKWLDVVLGLISLFFPFIGLPLLIIRHWEGLMEFFAGFWDFLKSFASSALEAIGVDTQKLGQFFIDIWTIVANAFQIVWFKLQEAFFAGVNFMLDLWDGFKLMFMNIGQVIFDIWSAVTTGLSNAWAATVEFAVNAWVAFAGFFTEVWDGLQASMAFVFNWLQETFPGVMEFVSELWTTMVSGLINAWDAFAGFLGKVFEGIIEAWNSVVKSLASAWNWVTDKIGIAAKESEKAKKAAAADADQQKKIALSRLGLGSQPDVIAKVKEGAIKPVSVAAPPGSKQLSGALRGASSVIDTSTLKTQRPSIDLGEIGGVDTESIKAQNKDLLSQLKDSELGQTPKDFALGDLGPSTTTIDSRKKAGTSTNATPTSVGGRGGGGSGSGDRFVFEKESIIIKIMDGNAEQIAEKLFPALERVRKKAKRRGEV